LTRVSTVASGETREFAPHVQGVQVVQRLLLEVTRRGRQQVITGDCEPTTPGLRPSRTSLTKSRITLDGPWTPHDGVSRVSVRVLKATSAAGSNRRRWPPTASTNEPRAPKTGLRANVNQVRDLLRLDGPSTWSMTTLLTGQVNTTKGLRPPTSDTRPGMCQRGVVRRQERTMAGAIRNPSLGLRTKRGPTSQATWPAAPAWRRTRPVFAVERRCCGA
jgi:hypothetical protein